MNANDFIKLLGSTYDDTSVKSLLTTLGITKKPKPARGDYDAVLTSPKTGVEVTFTDERFLDVRPKDYDDGALVVSNIRVYGDGSDFSRFKGEAPHGLSFDFDRKAALAKMGKKPAWENDEKTSARWDLKTYCVFVDFHGAKKGIASVSVQLPVE
jgi:hypothetical protein